MALPRPVTLSPIRDPLPRPIGLLATSDGRARRTYAYTSGSVLGGTLSYPELSSFAWYELATLDAPVRLRFYESIRDRDVFADAALELAFLPMIDLPLGSAYTIGDELMGPELYAFRIASRHDSGGLLAYTGETILADLDRTQPSTSLILVPGQGGVPDPLTPAEALRRMLEHYGVPYEGPLPEFSLRSPEGLITPRLEACVIRPKTESIYDLLQQFFAPFAGYVFRATAANKLEVVAPPWLEPNPEPALVLTQDDLGLEQSTTLDTASIINRATLTVRGYTFARDQQIMTPSAILLRGPQAVPGGVWPPQTIGPATKPDQEPSGYEVLANHVGMSVTRFWRVADDVVVQPGAPITISMEIEEWRDVWNAFLLYGGSELNYTTNAEYELPVDGNEYLIHNLRYEKYGIGGTSAWGRVYARWIGGAHSGIQLRIEHQPAMSGWTLLGGQAYFIYGVLVKLNGSGLRFGESGTAYTASFGYTAADDAALPGLAESRARYGERELRFDLGIYQVDEATALQICRAVVEANMSPREVRTLQIVPRGAAGYRVRPEHVGRLIQLPDGSRGIMRSYEYTEEHAPGTSMSGVTIEVELERRIIAERAGRRHYGRAKYRINHYQEV